MTFGAHSLDPDRREVRLKTETDLRRRDLKTGARNAAGIAARGSVTFHTRLERVWQNGTPTLPKDLE